MTSGEKQARRSGLWTVVGWLGAAAFALIYIFEVVPHSGPPASLVWIRETLGTGGLIALNILIVLAFLALLPYRRSTRGVWRSKGAFVAFVIALMTEMFGWPLLLFLLAPIVEVPSIGRPWVHFAGHWVAQAGTGMSLVGLALVVLGWRRIHRARGLVTDGIYRYLRHPQYTGLLLFTLGWLLHWPSVVTLALWPLMVAAYVWLARQEERQAEAEFGDAWRAYAARTRRFVPFLV